MKMIFLQFQPASWSRECEPKVWSRPLLDELMKLLLLLRRDVKLYSLNCSWAMTSKDDVRHCIFYAGQLLLVISPKGLWPLPKRLFDNPLVIYFFLEIFFSALLWISSTTNWRRLIIFVGRYLYQSVRESSNKNEILCIWCRYCFHTSTERHLLNFRLYTIEISVAVPIFLIN